MIVRDRKIGEKQKIQDKERTLIAVRQAKICSVGAWVKNWPNPGKNRLPEAEKIEVFFTVPTDEEEFKKMTENPESTKAFREGVYIFKSKYIITEEFDIPEGLFRKLLWE